MSTRTQITLDRFTLAYIECALWSSTDDGGEPMDANYSIDDIHPDSLAQIIADCAAFQSGLPDDYFDDNISKQTKCTATEYAGHDFWLTRNGHGCGFWDGDWSDVADEFLTRRSKLFGECDLYVGDDGMIHVS